MSTAAVELRGVSKQFGGVHALSAVDVRIRRGTVHALVGENGAGKSTLGKIVSGVHRPDAGEVLIDGEVVDLRSPRVALGHGVATIAQELSLLRDRSVLDNVLLGVEPNRFGVLRTRAARARFDELIARTGFGVEPDRIVGELRTAEQRVVEILRAVARDARVVVMDEPTAALFAEEARHLIETIKALRARGTTVVYVTHALEDVLECSDDVTVLGDGRVVDSVPAAGQTPTSLMTMMLGREVETAFPPRPAPESRGEVVLSLRGVSTAHVDDVTFDVRAGEIVGLAGLVGSGRTEVARAVFGADRLTSGTVEVRGRPVPPGSPATAIRAGIGMVPESRKTQGLLLDFPVVENITLPHLDRVSRMGVVAPAREDSLTAPLVESLDVRGLREGTRRQIPRNLSGGNQQKVMFAKWLLGEPQVLIVDEPTQGVDMGAKLAIYALLRRLTADGLAILMVSSEIEEIVGMSDRVLVMRGGRVVEELQGDEIAEERVMAAAFGTAVTTGSGGMG